MSDNSTGSSSSSSNSWTLLSPEEAAIDTAGPVDDGTGSTGDVPSLSEEVAGISFEVKPSDCEVALETILSEEGHQVCQETSPELFEEEAGAEADPEICAPVIHATITTSSSDNDLLEAVPFSIATESSHFLSQEPFIETSYEESLSDIQPTSDFSSKQCPLPETEAIPAFVDKIGPASEPIAEIVAASEPIDKIVPASEPIAEIVPASEPIDKIVPASKPIDKIGLASEPIDEIGPASEPVAVIGPASEPIDKIGPASEPIDKIGPASEPIAEIGPASEPIAEIGPASEPIAEIGPASEPIAEIAPASEHIAKIGPASEHIAKIGPASEHIDEIDHSSEPIAKIGPASELIAETDFYSEPTTKIGPAIEFTGEISFVLDLPKPSFPDVTADVSLASDISHTSAIPVLDIHTGVSSDPPSLSSEVNVSFAAECPYPETPASSVLEDKELITDREKQTSVHVTREAESLGTDVPIEHQGEDSGLRQRRVHYPEELRQSSDEEDGEDTEFKIPERKEEKPGLLMSHVIIGALALLCLSSFYFSDDFDGSELSDQELLDKFVEENKQISILEAQIQTQKEELDRALRAAAERGLTDEEHSSMKEELSALPSLKEELEALKARVSELTQLTGGEPSELSPGFPKEGQNQAVPDGRWGEKDELKRQKILREQIKTRLEGMKKQSWPKKWLRERLVEMQQRLLEHVNHMRKKDEWRKKHKEGENRKNGRGDSVQKHKDLVKKFHDEWEQRKAERKLEREKMKQERSWQARPGRKHKHELKDFWKLQEKKLRRNQNPPKHCHDVSGCAEAEGLVRVKRSDFQSLLDVYLNKLQGLSVENKEAFHHLVAQFFHGGVFSHDRMLFNEFVEDVADILEDLADILIDDDVLEEDFERFERDVLWHFAAKSIKSQS